MPDDFPVFPDPERKQSVRGCPLLEGNRGKAWVACCTRRFLPFARRLAGDDSLAEDVLQESWIKVLEAVGRARFDGPRACPWVRKIVANTARNARHQREHRGEEPLREEEEQDPNPDPEAFVLERERLLLVGERIRQLPDTCRQVLELRLKGLPNPEIARRLHISGTNVSTRLNRAVRLLSRPRDARLRSPLAAISRNDSSRPEHPAEKKCDRL